MYTPKSVYQHISQVKNDPILERRTCPISNTEFPIYQSDADVYEKASPTFAGQKFPIPFPTLCPEERRRRRLATRNERKLYRRTCDFSKKPIISTYSPNKPFTVYDADIRRSDKRNPLEYGRDFDFSQDFFPQFRALLQKVPLPALMVLKNENSPYVNCCGMSKNCYLSFNTDISQDCYYCNNVLRSQFCFNTINAEDSERCYDSYNINKSQKIIYSHNIVGSHAIYFSSNLVGCSFCFGCKNLSNKQYHIFNQPVTKEVFEATIAQYLDGTQDNREKAIQESHTFQQTLPEKAMQTQNAEHSYGNNLVDTKDCTLVYDGANLENVSYCSVVSGTSNTRDYDIGGYDCDLCVENVAAGLNYHCLFGGRLSGGCSDVHYCEVVANCKNCFACVGIRDKEYCIFNKQYTKEIYEQEVAKIITHMIQTKERGEFFPIQNSTYGYNESVAQQYFPLTKQEAQEKNIGREDYEYHVNIPDNAEIVDAQNIEGAAEDIIHKVILSKESKKPYRIMKKEYEFCQKNGIPLAQHHPDERFATMRASRPRNELHLRTCNKTNDQMLSIYPQNTSFPVWSNEVFDKEIFG